LAKGFDQRIAARVEEVPDLVAKRANKEFVQGGIHLKTPVAAIFISRDKLHNSAFISLWFYLLNEFREDGLQKVVTSELLRTSVRPITRMVTDQVVV
jgi:hypothetical protein